MLALPVDILSMVAGLSRGKEWMNGDGAQSEEPSFPLAQLSPHPIFYFDRHWTVIFSNRAARQMAGLPEHETGYENHWTIFPETLGTPVEKLLRSVMDRRQPGHAEFYRPADVRWFDLQAFPFQDGLAVYYQEITDRKLAETIRASTAREVQAFFDATPDSVLGMDAHWTITFCNQAARHKATPEDILGRTLWTRFPTSLEEPFFSHYHRAMKERVQTSFEALVPEPYNLWFQVNVSPFGSGILVLYTDITARKNAEAVRDATNRQLQQVLDATSDAVVSLDRDFNYTFLNRQAVSLLGRDDLLGKNVFQVFPPTEADALLRRTMHDRVACEIEVFNPAPLNSWFHVQTRPSLEGIVVFFRNITGERATRQSLLDQQATLAFVQQTARVATWNIDLSTRAMQIGEGSYPVWERPNAEIETIDHFFALVHPDDLSKVREDSRLALQDNEPHTVDYRIIGLDGTPRWLEGRAQVCFDASGRPTHMQGMTTDITARKLEEQKLRASEERYRVLADLNPQTLWIGEPDGSISYTNQGHLDYRGVTEEELMGARWAEGFYVDDQEPTRLAWAHAVATGEEYATEARIRSREGEYRWWSLRALPVRDEAGHILNWLGVAHDIHNSKTAAETLRRKQEQTERQRAELEAIYENAPIGLALFDPVDFRWLRLNQTQADIFDARKADLLHTKLFDLVKIEGVRDLFERVAAGNSVLDQLVEGELPSRPGEKRTWRVSYVPIFAADGSVEAITAASLEITRERRAEAALIQSEKLAAVGRLASSISHEINNPLEAVTNLLYIVDGDPALPDSAREYVQMAQSELTRVSQIATQTLRFHRQAVDRTAVTPAEIVNAVLNLYQGRLANSGITIDARYSTSSGIRCFENDIRQVLNNLIANAIDAMRGGGRLLVRAHDTTVSGTPGVRITIADTGHGMSAATQARIFEPFYTTKDLNGTGLGLWISAGIVDHHHGRLTVRSSQNPAHQGTVFTLFLPFGR